MRVKVCGKADKEHKQSKRQYAHTNHYPNTICISLAFYSLPLKIKLGIILHELGHLMGEKNEDKADDIIHRAFDITIYRVDNIKFGENLESI